MNKDVKRLVLKMAKGFGSFQDKSAQALVEYALILAFISIVAIAVMTVFGSKVTSTYTSANSPLQQALDFGS